MSSGLPAFLVDNLLSIAQYPNLSLAGNEELAGFEAFHVADGRRSGADYWSPITPNNPATLTWSDGRVRAADMIALDRGHNLAGVAISLLCSDDNFTTSETVFTATVPALSQQGSSLDVAMGTTTEELAWIKRFPLRSALYWRLSIPAMGVGILPNIVGLWVGKSWYPANIGNWAFNLPTSPEATMLKVAETESEAGWIGRGIIAPRREGTIPLKLTNEFDYDLARFNLEELYGTGKPMWTIFDDEAAERAFLVLRPVDQFGFSRESNWFFPQARIPYREHEPLRP